MNKVLDYFSIEGAVGGSQEWFRNVVMYIGGCAAATAYLYGRISRIRRPAGSGRIYQTAY